MKKRAWGLGLDIGWRRRELDSAVSTDLDMRAEHVYCILAQVLKWDRLKKGSTTHRLDALPGEAASVPGGAARRVSWSLKVCRLDLEFSVSQVAKGFLRSQGRRSASA